MRQAAQPLLQRPKVPEFGPDTASGKIRWKGLALKQRVSYHQLTLQFEDYKVWEDTPPDEYEDEQALPFGNPRGHAREGRRGDPAR